MLRHMNKTAKIISIFILSVSVMAGCGNQGTTDSPPTGKAPAAPESVAASPTIILQSLDEIKWDEVKDPLIEEGMITKLKAAIAAFVTKDLDQFHAALSPAVKTGYDYLLDQPVKFTGIAKAAKENDRILIPVVGERLNKEKGVSPDIRYTFYFDKNKDGAWQIVSID